MWHRTLEFLLLRVQYFSSTKWIKDSIYSGKQWKADVKFYPYGFTSHKPLCKLVHALMFLKEHMSTSLFLEVLQVRGLPCAHNFHIECIDEWLRLNVKCPRCRCSVFPNLDLSALSNLRTADSERSSASSVVTTTRYVRTQPSSQSYLVRMQGLLSPVHMGNTRLPNDTDIALQTVENGGVLSATQNRIAMGPFSSTGRVLVNPSTQSQHWTVKSDSCWQFLLHILLT